MRTVDRSGLDLRLYGIGFERTQIWWKNGAKAWCGYIARCQALLQAGTFVADVIHYIGHNTPNYLGHRREIWNPVPAQATTTTAATWKS